MAAPRPPEPILHVDMDAFYAAVEVQKDPALAGQPVLVGGTGARGVVASASYEARAYGVRSAMSMAHARRLCPEAVVLPPDFETYRRVSADLLDLLRSVTPLVEPLALDEAFLDVGGVVRLLGPPPRVAGGLRQRIRAELGLVASVGVAPNKFLAKLASAKAKPDGLLHLEAARVHAFLAPLSVRDLWGIGPRSADQLERFGIRTVADVRACPEPTLARILGPAAAAQVASLARGDDPRPVVTHEPAKGMSAEETFDRDVGDLAVLRRELLRLAEQVSRRLRHAQLAARTITVKLRDAGFTTHTRARTLAVPSDEATRLHREGLRLLEAALPPTARVRLLGLAATNLVSADAARQLELLEGDRWRLAEQAADAARSRFGDAAVTRGALLDDDAPRSGDAAAVREDWEDWER